MSTPTAGPDDRSPTLSDEQFSRVEEWANDSTMEPDRRFDLLAILSALRSARRDVAKAKSLEAVPPAERDSDGRIWLAGSFLDEDGNDQDLRWVAGVCQAARRLGYAITTEDHDQSNPTPFMLRMREYYAVSSSPPILEKNDRE